MRKLYHEHSLNSFQCLNMNRKKINSREGPEVAVCPAQEPLFIHFPHRLQEWSTKEMLFIPLTFLNWSIQWWEVKLLKLKSRAFGDNF